MPEVGYGVVYLGYEAVFFAEVEYAPDYGGGDDDCCPDQGIAY